MPCCYSKKASNGGTGASLSAPATISIYAVVKMQSERMLSTLFAAARGCGQARGRAVQPTGVKPGARTGRHSE